MGLVIGERHLVNALRFDAQGVPWPLSVSRIRSSRYLRMITLLSSHMGKDCANLYLKNAGGLNALNVILGSCNSLVFLG
jgi:hypothetical protein